MIPCFSVHISHNFHIGNPVDYFFRRKLSALPKEISQPSSPSWTRATTINGDCILFCIQKRKNDNDRLGDPYIATHASKKKRSKLPLENFMITGRVAEVIIRNSGDIDGQQFVIEVRRNAHPPR